MIIFSNIPYLIKNHLFVSSHRKMKKVKLGEMLSKYYQILSFSCEVMISFRTNIMQRTFSLSYRLVSIQTTNCFLVSLVKWGSLTEPSLLAASELSCFWLSSPFPPGRDALQFLLHTSACAILLLLTHYILHQVLGAHVMFASLYSLSCCHFE